MNEIDLSGKNHLAVQMNEIYNAKIYAPEVEAK